VPFLPASFDNYFEPFLGAGALLFLLRPEAAQVSDLCEPLVDTYLTIASDVDAVYDQLVQMDILSSETYYLIRAEKPASAVRQAARFLYLNRAAWNGLYRVNNKGEFNVPYGRPRSSNTVDRANLQACSEYLRASTVSVALEDFEITAGKAQPGDLVYFDPPYVTGHNNNGFIDYNQKLFSWQDQRRLADLAQQLQSKGVNVIISNAHHHAILELYPTFRVAEIQRRSALASNIAARKNVTEAVFY
jgi:DNA adenine methylase